MPWDLLLSVGAEAVMWGAVEGTVAAVEVGAAVGDVVATTIQEDEEEERREHERRVARLQGASQVDPSFYDDDPPPLQSSLDELQKAYLHLRAQLPNPLDHEAAFARRTWEVWHGGDLDPYFPSHRTLAAELSPGTLLWGWHARPGTLFDQLWTHEPQEDEWLVAVEDPHWLLTNQRLWLRPRAGMPVQLVTPADIESFVPDPVEAGVYELRMRGGGIGRCEGWPLAPSQAVLRHLSK